MLSLKKYSQFSKELLFYCTKSYIFNRILTWDKLSVEGIDNLYLKDKIY